MRSIVLLLMICIPVVAFSQNSTSSKFVQFQAFKYMEEGITEFESGRYDKSIDAFNRAADFDPNRMQIYKYRADARFQQSQYDQAVVDYSVALSLADRDPELYNARGLAYMRQANYYSAIQDFNDALDLDRNYTEARRNLEVAEQYAGPDYANTYDPRDPRYNDNRDPRYDDNRDPRYNDNRDPRYDDNRDPRYNSGSGDWGSSSGSTTSTGPRRVGNEFFRPTVGGQSQEYITIEKVKITRSSTFVTFQVKSGRKNVSSIFIHRPGSEGAFYITDLAFEGEYRLLSMTGLNWATSTQVPRRGSKIFTLEFERIPDSMQGFHIIEGKDPGADAWNFYEVQLK